jgi:hypothetical protein
MNSYRLERKLAAVLKYCGRRTKEKNDGSCSLYIHTEQGKRAASRLGKRAQDKRRARSCRTNTVKRTRSHGMSGRKVWWEWRWIIANLWNFFTQARQLFAIRQSCYYSRSYAPISQHRRLDIQDHDIQVSAARPLVVDRPPWVSLTWVDSLHVRVNNCLFLSTFIFLHGSFTVMERHGPHLRRRRRESATASRLNSLHGDAEQQK